MWASFVVARFDLLPWIVQLVESQLEALVINVYHLVLHAQHLHRRTCSAGQHQGHEEVRMS